MKPGRRLTAYLALLGNVILWAAAIPLAKRGFNDGLTPTAFLFGRFLLAALISVPIVWLIRHQTNVRHAFRPSNLVKIIALEILGTFLALWLLYEGVYRTTAVESALISITWPIFTVLGGIYLLHERENRAELTGLLLAVLGSLILVFKPLFEQGLAGRSAGGYLLLLGQNLSVALYYLLAKKTYRNFNKWAVTHISFWVGAAAFAGLIFLRGSTPWLELTFVFNNPSAWPLIAIVYMSVFGSILALTFYLIGQNIIEASEASVFTYLQPVLTIPLAIVLLNETLDWWKISGGFIILLGVYWSEIRRRSLKI